MMTPTENACRNGQEYSKTTSKDHKKSKGQFFTPAKISNFMAGLSKLPLKRSIKICDPGCGPAILTCSLVEKLVEDGYKEITADLFETDSDLFDLTIKNLEYLKNFCLERDVKLSFKLITTNFLIYVSDNLKEVTESYDLVISNPPYFKLKKGDVNIHAVSYYLDGITNIYAGFIAASIRICKISGECIFIVPRSFTSGLYFKTLRNFLFRESRIKAVHLFDSRTKTFKEDKVLQETVIFKTTNNEGTLTEISVSNGLSDLDEAKSFKYQITDLVDINSENKILHLPKNDDDFQLIQKIKRLQFRLSDHNIKVSTGRVVAFRSKSFISKSENVLSVPLIWGDNIKEQLLCWPLKSSKREQYISSEAGNLLIPSANYVVQRRFSAKEDKKRLICAPLLKSNFKFELIGLENKTNFFYKVNSRFTDEQVYGLSTLLNSSIYDSYFRMINGNINVSATEMRLLPLPSLEVIERLGKRMIGRGLNVKEIDDLVDEIVFTENLILEVA